MLARLAFFTFLVVGGCWLPQTSFAEGEAVPSLSPKDLRKPIDEIKTTDALVEKVREKPEIIEDFEGPPARSVRIDLKRVDGAHFYEVQVMPEKKIWSEPLKFVTTDESSQVRLRLSPGKYRIQTRSLNENKTPGRWSPVSTFWVQFRPIANAFPGPNADLLPKRAEGESIIFEWPQVESARYYFFRLKDQSGKIIRMAITPKNYLKSELKVDSNYSWSVLPMKQKEHFKDLYRQDQSTVYSPFSVSSPDTEARGTLVKIKPNQQAQKYQFEVVGVDQKDSASPPVIIDSSTPSMRFRLAPGEYEMRARSVYEDQSATEWSAPSRFFIKRFKPPLEAPEQGAELDPIEDQKNPVAFSWKKDPTASAYKVYVFNSRNQLVVKQQSTESSVIVDLPHDDNYRWTVRAYSAREPASDKVEAEDATGTFQIHRYIPLELNSAEEPSQYYAWVKQIGSIENYYGENFENNTIVQQKFFGGETEGAVGHWNRKSRFGLLAQGALAGFMFNNKNYTYANLGAHLGYRHLMDNGDRLRFWLGAAYREMPEVITNPFTTVIEYNKIKSLGPQFQLTYQHSLDEKKGIQISGTTFYSLSDQGTPNGHPQVPKLSYRASLMGTYVWSDEIRLMGGYTFRLEQAAYDSGDTPGAVNTARISGHYFSMMLEFALEPIMK